MTNLRGALGFLTVLPVSRGLPWSGAGMVPWFPVAGLVLGVLWALADSCLAPVFSPLLRAALGVAVLAGLTGCLHLDGLADTADGLLSHRGREEALRIMRDSRLGSWGGLALILVLGLKVLALAELTVAGPVWPALVLVPAWARLFLALAARTTPYARATGMGMGLREGGLVSLSPGAVLVLGLSFPLPGVGLAALLAAMALVTGGMLWWCRRALGGVTGDTLGALVEVNECAALVAMAAVLGAG